MSRLILICEGNAHTVEYFHKNNVYPGAVVFDSAKFREMSPYLEGEDEILLLIKGLTDFTVAGIYALINDLEDHRHKLKDVNILSNIDLGNIDTPYYLYTGDLFYGSVREVIKGKISDKLLTEEESEELKSAKKRKNGKSSELRDNPSEKYSINTVMAGYKKYDKRDVKFTIYGSPIKEVEQDTKLESQLSKIMIVDMYANNK
jgi:hypothetical protein